MNRVNQNLRRIFIVLILAIVVSSVNADTTEYQTKVEDFRQAISSEYYKNDPGVYLYGKAAFCINTTLPAGGQYYFRFEVYDPNGILRYEYNSPKTSVPTVPTDLFFRKYISPSADLFSSITDSTNLGDEWRLVSYFREEYTGKNLSVNQTHTFRLLGSNRPGTISYPPRLMQPEDGANLTINPTFVWTFTTAGSFYTLVISEVDTNGNHLLNQEFPERDPQNITIEVGIDKNNYVFNNPSRPLIPDRSYRWLVKAIDQQTNTETARSEIRSFSTGEVAVSDAIFISYPLNEKVTSSMPRFRFQTSGNKITGNNFTFTLSKGTRNSIDSLDWNKKVIWVQSLNSNQYQYPPNAPALVNDENVMYFWKVSAFDQPTNTNVETQESWFQYAPIIPKVTINDNNKTTITAIVLNHKQVSMEDAGVSFILCKEAKAEATESDNTEENKAEKTEKTAVVLNPTANGCEPAETQTLKQAFLSGENGRIFIQNNDVGEEITPGRYKIRAEKAFGEFINVFEAVVKIEKNINNVFNLTMQNLPGQISFTVKDGETGTPIRRAKVIVKGDSGIYTGDDYYTNQKGEFVLYIPSGTYSYAISKEAGYSQIVKNEVYIDGGEPVHEEVLLPKAKSGKAAIRVLRGKTGLPVPKVEVEVKE